MPSIHFQPDGVSVEAAPGESLLDAALRARLPHSHVCGGNGRCSTCRVLVLEGLEACSPRTAAECSVAEKLQFSPEIRLACQTTAAAPLRLRRLVIDEDDRKLASLLRAEAAYGSIGLQKELAILFSDVRGFTSFAEALPPYDVIHVLNRYFRRVGPIIERHGGYLNNYMGDGLMALFGLKNPKEAVWEAVQTGVEMMETVKQLNPYIQRLTRRRFAIGIGVHYGAVVVGAVGAAKNMRITAIGDAVNFASRIESENKKAGTRFLISEACFQKVRTRVLLGRSLRVPVPGKTGSHALFEVQGLASPAHKA